MKNIQLDIANGKKYILKTWIRDIFRLKYGSLGIVTTDPKYTSMKLSSLIKSDFTIGDGVEIEFLPKSKFIMSIRKI